MRFNFFGLPKRFQKALCEKPVRYFAAGAVLGMFFGLLPFGFNSLILLLLVFFLNIDRLSALLAAIIFFSLGLVIDPLAHILGLVVLQAGFLQRLWTSIYNLPFLPFTDFNNTLVLGNALIGIILAAPVCLLVKILVLKSRNTAAPVANTAPPPNTTADNNTAKPDLSNLSSSLGQETPQ